MNWGQFGICLFLFVISLSISAGCYGLYVLTRMIDVAVGDIVKVIKELKRLP